MIIMAIMEYYVILGHGSRPTARFKRSKYEVSKWGTPKKTTFGGVRFGAQIWSTPEMTILEGPKVGIKTWHGSRPTPVYDIILRIHHNGHNEPFHRVTNP